MKGTFLSSKFSLFGGIAGQCSSIGILKIKNLRFYSTYLELFSVTSKIERKVQIFPIYPWPHTFIAFSIISIPHHSGAFVTIDKPTLMHHNHPKAIVQSFLLAYILWVWTKCTMTFNSTIQSIFTSLKNLYALPIHSSSSSPQLSP